MCFRSHFFSRCFSHPFLIFLSFTLLLACGTTDPESEISADDKAGEKLSGEIIVIPQDIEAAATSLRSKVDCDPYERRKTLAHLSWQPTIPVGEEQFVQVTIFKNGFESGSFTLSKQLSGDANSYIFDDVAGQALHRWRILTKQGSQYLASVTERFEGALCLQDTIGVTPPPVIIE